MKNLKILFAASEVYPFVKTGGLADFAYGLSKALANKGHDIRVILPKYSQTMFKNYEESEFVKSIKINDEIYNIYSFFYNNITFYFVENRTFFERDTIYNNDDRDLQFTLFSDICLKLLKLIDFKADIIHCNDWHTGTIPYFLKTVFKKDEFYLNIKTVYTIHNLRYQGWFGDGAFRYLNYPIPESYVNFMKLGIQNADIINTVSKTYCEEIKTDYFGEGLNYELLLREDDLYGILNGIDYDEFNPEIDINIIQNYKTDSLEKKIINKKNLQNEFELDLNEDIPLIAIISRFTGQKGFDLIERITGEMFENNNFQLVVLGTGETRYQTFFHKLKNEYPNKVGLKIGYDEILARKIYAGADMLLMPSLFEPCGLSQLIAMRYATVPIVRETGGLNDTVKAYREDTGEGNGFSFKNYNAHDMMFTVKKAITMYNNDKATWKKLMKRGIEGNYSWHDSAVEYEKLYMKMINKYE